MTQATSLTSRWYERPRSIEPEGHDHEGKPYWKVEGITIRLGDGEKLELSSTRHTGGSALRIDVTDGELRFPLEDLVPLVLERMDIADLSEMICGDQKARLRLLDALAQRYNEHHIEDEDRRYWLAKAQGEIHDKKLDELVYAMSRIEQAVAQMGYRAMQDIAYANVLTHALAEHGVEWEVAKAEAEKRWNAPDLVDFKRFVTSIGISHDAWNEARDYWRDQVKTLFQNVEIPERPMADAEDFFA